MAGASTTILDRLQELLAGYGGRLMARTAIDKALVLLKLSPERLNPETLERLIEETMKTYRVFCPRERQAQLWIDLANFYEREVSRLNPPRRRGVLP
ncbi:MAG: hypothetical protein RMJ98_04525 [Myxococcales bacterium]|nr:hypothetical protein [Polyangiaceae bacterium]MDW8248557.1 hypothetical protein [Myxococcales bacterium]